VADLRFRLLEWLESRRANTQAELTAALREPRLRLRMAEINGLRSRLFAFDALIARHSAPAAAELPVWRRLAQLPPPEPLKPKPPPETAAKREERRRRAIRAEENAERRRLGLVDRYEPEAPEPPALVLPVEEVEETPDFADHVIADDVAKRAAVMISHGYSFGRRRSGGMRACVEVADHR